MVHSRACDAGGMSEHEPTGEQRQPVEDGHDNASERDRLDGIVEQTKQDLAMGHVDDAALQKLDAAARAACQPIDDKRGTKEYRIKVAGVLARRTALIALERARKA